MKYVICLKKPCKNTANKPTNDEINQKAVQSANIALFKSDWVYDHKSYEKGGIELAYWLLNKWKEQ